MSYLIEITLYLYVDLQLVYWIVSAELATVTPHFVAVLVLISMFDFSLGAGT